MFRKLLTSALLLTTSALAQAPAAQSLDSLDFLLGTWSASTNANGSAKATVIGNYTFARDLGGHAIQRTSSVDKCSGPHTFDCQHQDQLTIYTNSTGSLAAFYIDSEGHAIDYLISTPDPTTAIFTSQAPAAAPHFKLIYHLEGKQMTGKFQGAAPGSTDFHSYLEWSGTKQ